MGPSKQTLVVRNTFIDMVSDDPCEALERTQSDPIGGRTKSVLPFGGSPEEWLWQKQQENALSGEEPAMPELVSVAPAQKGGLFNIAEGNCCVDKTSFSYLEADRLDSRANHDMDDYECSQGEEHVSELGRTRSSAYPHVSMQARERPNSIHGGYLDTTMFSATAMSLNKLLPESEKKAVYAGGSLDQVYADFNVLHSNTALGWKAASAPFAPSAGGLDFATTMHDYLAIQQTPGSAIPVASPALGFGLPVGALHRFHEEACNMGQVSPDFRSFTKLGYEGRLSVVAESQIHLDGVHRYLVQFTSGELSVADGVGFMFSPHLPCTKNIQKIVSIFVNQRGRICMRVFSEIIRASAHVKPLELGDWVDMTIDLNRKLVNFNIWARTPSGLPPTSGRPASTAEFPFGNRLHRLKQVGLKSVELNVGHLACVVKNVGVTVVLGS